MAEKADAVVVFISHAGPDSPLAQWLAKGLQAVGIIARLDQAEIKAGDNIVTWMNDAIGESDYLLVLLSPETRDRYWVRMEWSNALMKEAHLCYLNAAPVRIESIEALDQLRRVVEFKDQLRREGLVCEFESLYDFEQALRSDLTRVIQSRSGRLTSG